jgi:type II secretory pathway pseudopilin PulG
MKNTAFTLIELVVSISIIFVLAALLLPSLASSRRAAKVETAKQYLKQQFIALELYAGDQNGEYPGYSDVMGTPSLMVPCSPMYDWKKPCWAPRDEVTTNPVDPNPTPMIGGRGYIYALKDWEKIDSLGQDEFLGWDRSKAYPLLCDIFSAKYRVKEFAGATPDLRECTREISTTRGCMYPDTMWFAYSDGSLRVTKNSVRMFDGKVYELFDWFHVFTRQIDNDTRGGR